MWLYGSGFPKSLDISKAIDKEAGAEREVVQMRTDGNKGGGVKTYDDDSYIWDKPFAETIPATPLGKIWNGWGTALKPAWEPIVVAMKPLDGTYAANAEKHGVAGLNIDGGRLQGNYIATRAENSYTTEVSWTDVPAHYFLEHLNYPEVLHGTVSGEVSWFLDRDDPGTINGSGFFDVTDGEFSADFLYSILEGQVEDDIGAIPADLNFSHFYSEVGFRQDIVETLNFKLESETIQLSGSGKYIRDGDLDYHINLIIAPETAERIPIMVEYFNVQGHKLANQDIELGFDVDGPTFRPRGEVAELPPARVTLLSGALGVTKEAIDFPRNILRGLLKIGGGIVGPGPSD